MTHPLLAISDEVREAMAAGVPVVALESTIISHGMPYPRNVEVAIDVEAIIRAGGAVPATIAVIGGTPTIGLDAAALDVLGRNVDVDKVSVRDLPFVLTRRRHGATTAAATMRLAALAGIRVFVTGGLGGVHRGSEHSMDISADLTELARTQVAVVSAGIKSILDIGLTLEVLETLSVPVVVFGADEFPSFFSRSSGFPAPARLDTVEHVASLMRATWSLGVPSGIAVTVPVPVDAEIPRAGIATIIDQALADAGSHGVRGKDVTPFLLSRIVELTGGASLETNIALVHHNARIGAAIAHAYAALPAP